MKLTPMRESALRAMLRGPLRWQQDGWHSVVDVPGCWNSITIWWLGSKGLAQIYWDNGVKRVKIRSAGRELLSRSEELAA